MTWTETRRRWQALRAIEQELGATDRPALPWNDELALIFGDRAGLRAALRYRWRLAVTTQLDTHLPERVLEEQRRLLAERARGVLAVLDSETGEELGTTHAVA
ncbi:hypothetical protein [Nocardioides daeguensis]|uniref:Uncharacterized protein n=1 Tax=Nocardioides daeguensis TaxID=908359 RepID=A0ABP6VKT4_9ACTN|nr:hypothetical protein [Nocardioides daeguensis]MBV6728966.1 hypothetical protein [Nocardioides daeguensis]MCR1773487.1 hypothetical protein [Nocardioides daeguensis]